MQFTELHLYLIAFHCNTLNMYAFKYRCTEQYLYRIVFNWNWANAHIINCSCTELYRYRIAFYWNTLNMHAFCTKFVWSHLWLYRIICVPSRHSFKRMIVPNINYNHTADSQCLWLERIECAGSELQLLQSYICTELSFIELHWICMFLITDVPRSICTVLFWVEPGIMCII